MLAGGDHLGGDVQVLLPEMAEQADPQPRHGSGRGALGLGARARVLGVESGERVQQQAAVLGRPRQWTAVIEGEGVGNDPAAAHQAVARHETGGAGERGRTTNRTAGIGAERPETEPGRHCHPRSGRRPAGEMLDVPGVAGRRPRHVEARAAMGVFMRRELAGDDGARGLEAAHRLRVPLGDPANARLRSPGGQHAFGVVDVLERDGHPVQRPPAATGRDLGVRRSRRLEGALGHERHVGVEAGVVGLDARERRLDELERLELPRRDHPGRIGQREVRQIDHVSLSSHRVRPRLMRPSCPQAFAGGGVTTRPWR